jgi:predicted NUDIX family NTP pyrophosphohydrolase
MAPRTSAGILLYRRSGADQDAFEVLLAHPGGPYFEKKDLGDWTIRRASPTARPRPFLMSRAASSPRRPGPSSIPPHRPRSSARSSRRAARSSTRWAVEGDLDPSGAHSNEIEIEWPPRSGRLRQFPEIDPRRMVPAAEARRRIKETQVPFIDRLEAALRD